MTMMLTVDPLLLFIILSIIALLIFAIISLLVRGRRVLAHSTWWGFLIRCGLWLLLMVNMLIGLIDHQFLSDATEVMIQSIIVGFFLFALYDRWREELRAEKQREKLREREQQLERLRAKSEQLSKWDGPSMSVLL